MKSSADRRAFLKTGAALAASAPFAILGRAPLGGAETINLGIVGCGGRGSGAVNDSLSANPEGVRLVAMADVFGDKARSARKNLQKIHGDRIAVPDENIFEGLDGYKKVINHPDVHVVLLTTSPGFRPLHLAEVVRAKKHCFAEKPVCVDPAGYRSVMESAKIARANGTAIVTGTQYRRQPSYAEAIKRIHDGMIGEIRGGTSYYCSTGIWYRNREANMSDTEYQIHNWYHFLWLCGDQIAEQAVHNIDAVHWAMGGPPVKAYASGGQMTRPKDSEIWDNISVDYTFPNGAPISFKCRQVPNSQSDVSNMFLGTKGIAHVNPGSSRILDESGKVLFNLAGDISKAYKKEHADLIACIREGKPIVEIEATAEASLMAVQGRMAGYTGQRVTWDQATTSKLDLMPKDLDLKAPLASRGVAIPGREELI